MATGAKPMGKSPDAFRTISEVAAQLETPAHVLRFWESKFTQIKPVKRAGGRRYYRPDDIALLGGIKVLLHEKGMTIKGVVNLLKERGVRHVATLSALPWEGLETEEDAEDASESVIVGPWPGAPAQEGSDSVGTESSCDADAGEAESSLIGDFVAGAIARPEAPAALPEAGAKDRSGGLARLRAALAGADRDRLKAQAGQFAPLVERLRALRHAAAEGAL